MRLKNPMRCAATATILTLAVFVHHASTLSFIEELDRPLHRRQASRENEQESTTPKSQTVSGQDVGRTNEGGRLYPDLPQQPNFIPRFNAPSSSNEFQPLVPIGIHGGMQSPPGIGQRPFAPFGRQPQHQPRYMTPAERLQSHSFADGLGRRLLSLVGFNMSSSGDSEPSPSRRDSPIEGGSSHLSPTSGDWTMNARALQNSSLLQQLNKGLNSIYGGLSKMYNSTVQEQVAMLQDRFRQETANSTNAWQLQMAQRVPKFFEQMVNRVAQAQEQLNQVMRDIANANVSTLNSTAGHNWSRSFFNGDFFNAPSNNGHFFTQFGRSLGFNPNEPGNQADPNQVMAARVRDFWTRQVQPRIGLVHNQIMRAWRDLTSSGALMPFQVMSSRTNGNNNNNNNSSNEGSSDLVDNILKDIQAATNSEYLLIEPKGDLAGESADQRRTASEQSVGGNQTGLRLHPQMQARLMDAQRELSQVWMGLAGALQTAIVNVRRTLNPQPRFATFDLTGAQSKADSRQEPDPAQNEISDKIKELTKLQRNADMVHEAVQQQQRETQQNQSIADRFRGLFNNMDTSTLENLPDRLGRQFSSAVGNFWNQIPNRWDDFMTHLRPQDSTVTGTGDAISTTKPTTERRAA